MKKRFKFVPMQFLYPGFLWALSLIALPILIHLFHFRRFRKVYFTNVHLLREIREETSTRSKLRDLIILTLRCLALVFAVLAFAQPYIQAGTDVSDEKKAICIYVDNSFSMMSRKDEVELFTLAKDKAREIVSAYTDSEKFLILTNQLEGRHQRFVDKMTALGFIEELVTGPETESLDNVLRIISRIGQNQADYKRYVYLLSDFQQNMGEDIRFSDSLASYKLLPFRALQENNVAITEVSLEAPAATINQTNNLIVQIENFGEQSEDIELRMIYRDQERPLGTISLPPRSVVKDTVSLLVSESGWQNVEFSISDYPVEFDNNYYCSVHVRDRYNALSIKEGGSNNFLHTAFESLGSFDFTEQDRQNVRYDEMGNYQILVLDDLVSLSTGLASELDKYVRSGGSLLIFPSERAEIQSYNDFLNRMGIAALGAPQRATKDVSEVSREEFIFRDVFQTDKRNIRLPQTQLSYPISTSSATATGNLMRYRDGSSFLQRFDIDAGHIFLCSSPLKESESDLVLNAEVFLPMLYKMAVLAGRQNEISYLIGRDERITIDAAGSGPVENYLVRGSQEFIPGVSVNANSLVLDIRGQIRDAGYYEVFSGANALARLAFNYDRAESDVRFADLNELVSRIGPDAELLGQLALADVSSYISERHHGVRLWRWFLLLCLVALLFESILLRFWK